LGHTRVFGGKHALYPGSLSGFVTTLLDLATATPLQRFVGHSSFVSDAALSRDETTVVSVSFDATARLWDALSGRPLATYALTASNGEPSAASGVDLLPGGGFVAGLASGELAAFTSPGHWKEVCP
ncbi:MAG: hypothetical protein IOD12_18450, partial [Silvanigrellales bacterium]|nr:hypothetical protein [Silvanigrellales bacterium]